MFEEPSFLIQVGHGGKPRVEKAIEYDYSDGAILSPADYNKKKNINLARDIHEWGGVVLFDPQYYIPESERRDLHTYPYFQSRGGESFKTAIYENKDEREALCRDILSVQEDDLDVDAYIAPARFLDTFSQLKLDRWLDLTESFLEVVEERENSKEVYASLPIDGKQLNDPDYRSQLLNRVTSLDPDGFYVSVKYDYSVRYPLQGGSNVKSFLKLLASLRENRYKILVGHTHYIAHLLFAVGVNAFASGNYKNLRAFDTNRWDPSDGDSFGRQTVRYYSDTLLNDVRVDPDLQYLHNSNFPLDALRIDSPFENDLFDPATTPEESGWAFSDQSWDHYIWACDLIRQQYSGKDLADRIEMAERSLDAADIMFEWAEESVNEINEEFDKLSNEHYSDWRDALKEITSGMNKTSIRLAMR